MGDSPRKYWSYYAQTESVNRLCKMPRKPLFPTIFGFPETEPGISEKRRDFSGRKKRRKRTRRLLKEEGHVERERAPDVRKELQLGQLEEEALVRGSAA